MKKVLFITLALAIGMSGFAQKNISTANQNVSMTAEKPSALRVIDGSAAQGIQFNMPETMVKNCQNRDWQDFTTMTTNYDLQSNSALGNRMTSWPDGSVSIVATWDHSALTNFPDRGTGYNFYDGNDFGAEPEERQESVKSGWPSICACGDGELLASHATGVNLYYRPTKGEGEWTLLKNWGADYNSPTWPRVVCSGPNDEYIHIVMCKQISVGDGYDNHVYYSRSTDHGATWSELIDLPLIDNDADGEYRNQFSADDYVMAANGNNVAILLSAYTTEVVYIISHDNGETWERQIVAPFPIADAEGNCVHAIDFDDYPSGMTDTIHTSDNSHSIVIDNNGVVHVTFGLFHWKVADASSYSYWPAYGYGILYWNSNYVNEQGGHEILPFGQSAVDVNHPEWTANGLGYTLIPERLEELAAVNGQDANLHVFGWIDDNHNGVYGEYENVVGATWHYRSLGLCTMPSISFDLEGNIAIAWSVWSEARVSGMTSFSFRSAFVAFRDAYGTWFDDADNAINLCDDFVHEYEEAYPTFSAPKAYNNGEFWVGYSADEYQGLYLDISDSYPESNNGVLTENYIYAVKVTPNMTGWGTEEHDAVNPMTTARIYPNPVQDVLNIEVNASQSSALNISVYNIMGQKVMEKDVTVNTGINVPTLSTSSLTSGIYFVTVKANGFENTMKFIVK